MTAPTTLGQSLCKELDEAQAVNLLISAGLLAHMAIEQPATLTALRSALGNTYIACLVERSASRPDVGAIRCDENPDCRSVFISPYVEGYTVAYSVNGPALLVGGV